MSTKIIMFCYVLTGFLIDQTCYNTCTRLVDLQSHTVVYESNKSTWALFCIPDQLTVWNNGIELLEDNTFLPLSVEGGRLINLRCLGTEGNYDLIWNTVGISNLPQVISRPLPNINVSYVANEANLTLYNFNRFAGTLRCVSQQSGLAVSIHLTTSKHL